MGLLHTDHFPLFPPTRREFLSMKSTAILHHITKDDPAEYLIEDDRAFKSRIEKSYAEYGASSGMIGHELIRRLERRCEKENA